MKKNLPILFLVLICVSGILGCLYYSYNYIVVKGGPSKRTLTINGCKADYMHYMNDNVHQIAETHGHAYTNTMELGEAKVEIARCLCDSYLKKKNSIDSTEIVNILYSEEYNEIKPFFEDRVEDFSVDTIRIEKVCKEKEIYLGRILID